MTVLDFTLPFHTARMRSSTSAKLRVPPSH
jgi:hypothetical protein